MVVLVISHTSTFASYLIAFSIFLYYRTRRRMKIIVVELSAINLNQTNHDLKPWCGVTTLNNLHFDNHTFVIDHLLFGMLLLPELGILPLNLVNISRRIGNNRPINMDIPMNSQNDVIQLSLSDTKSSTVGLIYHPVLIMNKLRFIMSSTNKVVFTSLAKNLNIIELIGSIKKSEPFEDVISLDYTDAHPEPMNNSGFLIHSNLMNAEYLNSKARMSRKPPSYILWLPKFRGHLKISGYGSVQHQFTRYKMHTQVNIMRDTITLNDKIVIDIDLFSGLKLADYTLKVIDQMINLGNISLNTNRL